MALLEVNHLNKRFVERSSLFHKQDFYAVKEVSFYPKSQGNFSDYW